MKTTLLAVFLFLLPVPALADFGDRLADAALERTRHAVTYDGSYARIAYPMGDVAADRGVCSDVVVRSYRALGIDKYHAKHTTNLVATIR